MVGFCDADSSPRGEKEGKKAAAASGGSVGWMLGW